MADSADRGGETLAEVVLGHGENGGGRERQGGVCVCAGDSYALVTAGTDGCGKPPTPPSHVYKCVWE